ncbi:MAG: GreA/GreB family elongation factor, partial [Nitrospinota bacterium]|nr:GreA/GreB family elongation factor [Nitrospinota bacterium]
GEDEADVENGKISVTSPIARALIGKEPDDTAVAVTPGGKREFTILEII